MIHDSSNRVRWLMIGVVSFLLVSSPFCPGQASEQVAEGEFSPLPQPALSATAFTTSIDPATPAEAAVPTEQVEADSPTNVEELRQRIEKLEKALDESKKGEAGLESTDGAKKVDADEKKSDAGWIDISTEKWTVKLGGHVQLDYINWASASPSIVGDQDYFEFRRLRLVADGTGYGVFDFRLQFTLEPEATREALGTTIPDVKDAYFSMNHIPWLGRFRIGNFFVPSSLEQVTNDTNNIFLERSIPTQGVFAADREVGVAFYNCNELQTVTWTYGAFFDSISDGLKERIDDNQGYRLAGRVTWLPYYDEPSNGRYLIHTGANILYTDDQDGQVRLRSRPQIHEGPRLIDTGILNADATTTGGLEFAAVMGSVTIQSEAFLSAIQGLEGGDQTVNGCYIHGSWFLTGESRKYERFGQHGAQFGRNEPFTNVFWVKGAKGFGAWELKARWSHLDLTTVNAGQYNDATFGFNWYWSDRTRIMFDWIHPLTTAQTPFGSTNSDILAMRFDFNW